MKPVRPNEFLLGSQVTFYEVQGIKPALLPEGIFLGGLPGGIPNTKPLVIIGDGEYHWVYFHTTVSKTCRASSQQQTKLQAAEIKQGRLYLCPSVVDLGMQHAPAHAS